MDNQAIYFLLIFSGIILIFNIIATYIVLTTYFEVKARRIYQLLLTWFIPIIGALLVIYINREDYFARNTEKQIGNNTNITDSDAIDHAIGANHRGGR